MKMRIKTRNPMDLAERHIDLCGQRLQLFSWQVAGLPLDRSKLLEQFNSAFAARLDSASGCARYFLESYRAGRGEVMARLGRKPVPQSSLLSPNRNSISN